VAPGPLGGNLAQRNRCWYLAIRIWTAGTAYKFKLLEQEIVDVVRALAN
jgi:hypothetical protein